MTAEIVVAHCTHAVATWLPRVRSELEADGLAVRRVTIYSKCGQSSALARAPELRDARIVRLRNAGRCDHVYTYHLANSYHSLADIVLLLKDSTWSYPLAELRSLLRPLPEVINLTRAQGFGCFRRPDLGGLQWAVRRELFKFRLCRYTSADQLARQRRKARLSEPAQDAAFAAGFGMCEFAARVLGNGPQLRQLLNQSFVPVCYGGSFATTAARVHTISQRSFSRLETLLGRGDTIEEGHFAERLWAATLQQPMPADEQLRIASGAGHNFALVNGMLGISYTGSLKRCCCERSPRELERRPSPLARIAATTTLTQPVSSPAVWANASSNDGAQLRGSGGGAEAELFERERGEHEALRVVLVSHAFDLDGAPRYLLQLAQWLRTQGHAVLCATAHDGPLGEELRLLGVRTAVLPGLRQGLIRQYDYLQRELRAQPPFASPDMLVFNTVIWADLMYAHDQMQWCRRAPRVVWVLHELELDAAHKAAGGYWWGRDYVTLRSVPLLRRTLLSPDAVVFASEAQRAIWLQHDHAHFHVIPGHAEHAAADVGLTRAELGISATSFLLSTVGTVCERKRQGLAMDALEHIVRNGADAHLMLVGAPSKYGGRGGESDYMATLRRRAESEPLRGRVTFVPFDRSGWRFAAIADLHLSTSTHEAYPLNTLEAMRQGVPVIATAAGGTAEQFAAEEVGWMVTPVRSAAEFIAAVERAHRLHTQGALARLGTVQQEFAAGALARFSEGWAELVGRLRLARRVNRACELWSPDDACEPLLRVQERIDQVPPWAKRLARAEKARV